MPRAKSGMPEILPGDTGDLCERDQKCAGGRRSLETGEVTPARAAQHVCQACRAVLAQSLAELPALYYKLTMLSRYPARSGKAVRVPPGSRVLLNAEADALTREAADITGAWASRVRGIASLSRHAYVHGSVDQVRDDCHRALMHENLNPLLALPPGPVKRTWTWPPGGPMPADLEEAIGHLDYIASGDGWVTAFTSLHGGDAACELIDLRHRAVRLLRENPAPPEVFDGIPCRSCEAMGSLERAHLPAGPGDPDRDPYSRCSVPGCHAEMTAAEHQKWAQMYAAWVKGAGILTCARCDAGRCSDCSWASCHCRAAGHAAAA